MELPEKKIWTGIIAIVIVAAAAVGLSAITVDDSGNGSLVTVQGNAAGEEALFINKSYPEYARGFSIEYHGTYKVISIHDPWGRADENFTYLLVQRGEEIPAGYPDAQVFFIPVRAAVTLSPIHLSQISQLNESGTVKGHNAVVLMYDEEIRRLVQEGSIEEIGSSTQSMTTMLKMERIIELEPDVVFCVANGNREYDSHYKLREVGLKPAVTAEWMENHPLARAEWIKFIAYFYNREREANDFFDGIKNNYTAVSAKTKAVVDKPTVFSGIDYQGTWYAPGGDSYVATLFRDAGAEYFLPNDNKRGGRPLDFEVVYERAHDADYWINIGYSDNINELLALDPRYAKFGAFKSGNIYHYNARVSASGGNDYWQSGVLRPDIVLQDLVKILHPELVPDHELHYYRHIGSPYGEAA
ncbi:MAG: ABC transporter substrate-binding protein [Methanomicrobiaceae archaeon]|nr:ABC transporter substrate-binding protein [Methanomicrobiaceae archaeon]MDD5419249.1 ABC transporter substrate-binding protein [Methanomicrobiaceae archaeon]